MNLSKNQQDQDDQYEFPYHYLVEYNNNKISLSKNWGWAIEYLGRTELIVNFLQNIKFNNLLDVGCGDGKLINLLSNYYSVNFTGIDYSERAISLANIMNTSKKNVIFQKLDIFNEFLPDKFDVISMVEVIEHIEPEMLDNFLENSLKHLNKGGYFIGSVPSTKLKIIPKHYQHFTIDSLSTILKKHAVISKIFYIDNKDTIFRLLSRFAYLANKENIQNLAFNYYRRFCLDMQNDGEGVFFICRKK